MHELITLDRYDAKLLTALQSDGSLTNQQLCDIVNLSASQCSRRRHRLEEAGLIERYRAQINRTKAGQTVTAFIHVTMSEHSQENAQAFYRLIEATQAIQEAHILTGEADYLLKVVARDLQDLERLIREVLLPCEAVSRVRSEIALGTVSERNEIPIRF